jgi:hypothetical protein
MIRFDVRFRTLHFVFGWHFALCALRVFALHPIATAHCIDCPRADDLGGTLRLRAFARRKIEERRRPAACSPDNIERGLSLYLFRRSPRASSSR